MQCTGIIRYSYKIETKEIEIKVNLNIRAGNSKVTKSGPTDMNMNHTECIDLKTVITRMKNSWISLKAYWTQLKRESVHWRINPN